MCEHGTVYVYTPIEYNFIASQIMDYKLYCWTKVGVYFTVDKVCSSS